MALFNIQAHAVTFEEYIVDQDSPELKSYLTGYIDALYDNAYLIGGCPRKLPYRPYGEFFQHIDVYIAQESQVVKKDLEKFYKKPVEPFITAVVLKYISCANPESLKLQKESKVVQIATREIARNIMEETKKYSSPIEKEKDFQYSKFLDRLKNPAKYEKKCPTCKVCPEFKPAPLTQLPKNQIPMPPQNKQELEKVQGNAGKFPKKEITLEDTANNTANKADAEKLQEIHLEKQAEKQTQKSNAMKTKEERLIEEQILIQGNKLTEIANYNASLQEEMPPQEMQPPASVQTQEGWADNSPANSGVPATSNLADKLKEIEKTQNDSSKDSSQNNEAQQLKLDEKVAPLALPTKAERSDAIKKGLDKINAKADDAKYKLEKMEINFENLDAITLPD